MRASGGREMLKAIWTLLQVQIPMSSRVGLTCSSRGNFQGKKRRFEPTSLCRRGYWKSARLPVRLFWHKLAKRQG
jgi:hypothetical protein